MELALDSLRLPRTRVAATMPAVVANDLTDGELISRTGDGDRGAFEVLYRRYSRPVFGLALRRLGDRGRAEDAVQETFASIWRSARSYRPERGPGAPWLYAVARNAIVDRAPGALRAPGRGARRGLARAGPARAGRGRLDRLARAPGARGALAERARGDRARLLERALAVRDRRVPRHSARHREDAHPRSARPPRRSARKEELRVTDRPDFRELVGDDSRTRSARGSSASTSCCSPRARRPSCRPRSSSPSPSRPARRDVAVPAAAPGRLVLGIAAAVGVARVPRRLPRRPPATSRSREVFSVPMHGTAQAANASATIRSARPTPPATGR